MKWLDRLLGKAPRDDEDETDAALSALRSASQRVSKRTARLEAELRRVNAQLADANGKSP